MTTPPPADSTDPLERMAQIGDGMRALRGRVAAMREAWPTGEVFTGKDASGALHLELTSQGRVSRVELENDWVSRISSRSLASAVNQALGQASAKLGDAWLDNWDDSEDAAAKAPPRPRKVTLAEYRAAYPAPKTREELRDRAEQVAQAREARERREFRAFDGPDRESFMSPRGRFTVTRSGDRLTGLESLPNALATMTPEDVGREIVAVLDEIHHRALGDDDARATRVSDPLRAIRNSH